ncbi:MAG: hypothetical protein M5R36_20775 [Deltaproteobacteria bacterium]|nr:hypothetical protein [Deltaproteobacteria bacterium]
MGRLLGSAHPGRLVVLTSASFAFAHLAGLLLWSGLGETTPSRRAVC